MKHFKVNNINSGAIFTVNEGESILTAALRQGVMLPYSCKNGTCGSCKGRLESGEVHYPFHPPLALSREEIGDGFALFCQAEPTEDLVIRIREIEAVRDAGVSTVQLDEPWLCTMVDPDFDQDPYRKDLQYEMDLCADLINQTVDGIDGIPNLVKDTPIP